jgi:hypothetical protein
MRYEVTTRLTPQEALDRASAHFGPQGEGLEITGRDEHGIVFQGGGGYVAVTAQPGEKTVLELTTNEWDRAVQEFMSQVHWVSILRG